MMMRASGIVGVSLLALSFLQQADATTVKQRQRAACGGMRPGDVSHRVHAFGLRLSFAPKTKHRYRLDDDIVPEDDWSSRRYRLGRLETYPVGTKGKPRRTQCPILRAYSLSPVEPKSLNRSMPLVEIVRATNPSNNCTRYLLLDVNVLQQQITITIRVKLPI